MENINLDKIIKSDELDHSMILSVPEEIGLKLQRIIQGQATPQEKNSTQIEIIENTNESMDTDESRKMILKINDVLLPITILDFPCIIEAQKTIDNKTFYKSGDISQMMFVHDRQYKLSTESEIEKFNPFRAGDETFNKIVWKKDYDHKYKLRSGLGKSTRNIRSKIFKRRIRYNGEEILDVSKTLKSIIDGGAANFENQMKNKESVVETMENQSIIHSASERGNIMTNFMIPVNTDFDNISSNVVKIQSQKNSNSKKKKKAAHEFNVPINTKKNVDFGMGGPLNANLNITLPIKADVGIGVTGAISNSNAPINFKIPIENNSQISVSGSQNKINLANLVTIPNNASNISNVTQQPTPKEKILIDEYLSLKAEYKKLKKELEINNLDEDKIKRKKKIKKKMKEIKKNYKGE